MKRLDISDFVRFWRSLPIIDVRSPSEYRQGHIPGAINIPLFNDEERAHIGKEYSKTGKIDAIQLGLGMVGPRLSELTGMALKVAPKRKLLIHCWRGGMRSEGMGWLLDQAGFDVNILDGGYKRYRSFIREQFRTPARICVIGGKTGSGKTAILQELANFGEQVLDLEILASHRGSAFGSLGMPTQPTCEQFENDLYHTWQSFNLERTIWMEDESLAIGAVTIPEPLFQQLTSSPLIEVDIPRNTRIERLVREYSAAPAEELITSILRLEKRLGGEMARKAIEGVKQGNFHLSAGILLTYYDKAYAKSIRLRQGQQLIMRLSLGTDDPVVNARKVLNAMQIMINDPLHYG